MVLFRQSTTKGKKYDAFYNGKWIPFGSLNHEHFSDTALGIYSDLDHNDLSRRYDYWKRHSKIKKKDGSFAYKDKNSPAYYSMKYLWSINP